MYSPPYLKPGDAIRVIAPAGVFGRGVFDEGLTYLEEKGFEIRLTDRIFETHRYFAGTDEARLQELNQALAEEDTKAIWVARGGYGSGRLLSGIEFPEISKAKWLIGFSDVTAMHLYWQSKGVASIHGANITTIDGWSDDARNELWSLLEGESTAEFIGEVGVAGESVSAPVTGGNLTVINSMVGTGQLPSFGGQIVVLEDIGERTYRLDRHLFQLKAAGVFDGAVGVGIGQLTHCESGTDDYTSCDVVVESLQELGVPILTHLEIGHETNSRPILMGGMGTLDSQKGSLTLNPPSFAP